MNQNPWSVKRTQSAKGPRWPGHHFCRVWKAFTSTRNQTYASDTSRNPPQSCLVFHSILDLLQKPLFEQTLTHHMILFYHICLKTADPKKHEQKRWETRSYGSVGQIKHFLWFSFISGTFGNKRKASRTASSKERECVTVVLFQTNMPEQRVINQPIGTQRSYSERGKSQNNGLATITPFMHLLLTNGTPFTYQVSNIASQLTAVSKIWRYHRSRTFPRLFHSHKMHLSAPLGLD